MKKINLVVFMMLVIFSFGMNAYSSETNRADYKKGGVYIEVVTDKDEYYTFEDIAITLFLVNKTDENIIFHFGSSCHSYLLIYDSSENIVYDSSKGLFCTQGLTTITIAPNSKKEIGRYTWNQVDEGGTPVISGRHKVSGRLFKHDVQGEKWIEIKVAVPVDKKIVADGFGDDDGIASEDELMYVEEYFNVNQEAWCLGGFPRGYWGQTQIPADIVINTFHANLKIDGPYKSELALREAYEGLSIRTPYVGIYLLVLSNEEYKITRYFCSGPEVSEGDWTPMEIEYRFW